MTIRAITLLVLPARNRLIRIKLYVIRDKQVEVSIAVVIKPSRRRRPSAIVVHARLRGYIGERPIAIVVIQRRMPVASHVNVRKSVVIKIADGHAKEKRPVRSNARLLRHVRKSSIAVVSIERWLWRPCRMKIRREAAIYKKCVEPSIPVVIDPRDTRPHRFRVKFLLGRRSFMTKPDPRCSCHIPKFHLVAIRAGLLGRGFRCRFRWVRSLTIPCPISGRLEEKCSSQCNHHESRDRSSRPCFILEHRRK